MADDNAGDGLEAGADEGEVAPSALVQRLGPFWTPEHTSQALEMSGVEELEQAIAAGRVLGLQTSDGALVVPVFQFESIEGRVRVRPHLDIVMTRLRSCDSWSVALLIRDTPMPELGGLTVIEAAAQGRVADLQAFANVVHSEWGDPF
ncbi:hypothetical protein [Aeromicrobium sp. 9AM]|uniref:hypothetical protein n=1 Tax=Aeromicrobium sp. 9AM TaxID=2653126 RepID=UPI0012F40F3B|nr:hypothetical protein [Aeromicrobium sp. 9AM]VXB04328.1 hypothetical protein AERO9AM_10268 [Aeromicrobium sp. 9AM]